MRLQQATEKVENYKNEYKKECNDQFIFQAETYDTVE